jgi:hypothetical protein
LGWGAKEARRASETPTAGACSARTSFFRKFCGAQIRCDDRKMFIPKVENLLDLTELFSLCFGVARLDASQIALSGRFTPSSSRLTSIEAAVAPP